MIKPINPAVWQSPDPPVAAYVMSGGNSQGARTCYGVGSLRGLRGKKTSVFGTPERSLGVTDYARLAGGQLRGFLEPW
jgi:hypothetical protein